MTRARVIFRCSECGASAPRWAGRCSACQQWNTLVEEVQAVGAALSSPSCERPLQIADVDVHEWSARRTGLSELDRVLGGGLVPGSVTLLGGEPGIGKSTLLLQVAAAQAATGVVVLYVSAEESRQQVRLRAERLAALPAGLWLVSGSSVPEILGHVQEVAPDLLIVDSIQTVSDPSLPSGAGSVGQVRECAQQLARVAKSRGMATVLVGHVTKDGGLAGPRVLEHLVDTVLSFEGDRHHSLRLLRAVKHRFGSTHELGLFEMGEAGLQPVPDPSALFLCDRRANTAGSVVVPTIDGFRPLLVEIQGLVVESSLPSPRRTAQGLDSGRLALLLAVLDRRVGLRNLAKQDVHALAVGGVRVTEPGADLALSLAIVSAMQEVPIAGDLVACGEVGLGGEVRQVAQIERRLGEAARLGFRRAIIPASSPEPPVGIEALRAGTVAEAIALARPRQPSPGRRHPGLVSVGG